VNKDLADVLGNFVNRTLQLTSRNFGNQIPAFTNPTQADMDCAERLNKILERYTGHLEKIELRKAIEALRELWVAGNEYLASQEPWQVVKTDKERAASILNIACNMIFMYARAMEPVIPFTAQKLKALFADPASFVKPDATAWPSSLHTCKSSTSAFTLPTEVLFPKISDEQRAEWEAKFGNTKA
jgi:methionyl-tRNA synthetase